MLGWVRRHRRRGDVFTLLASIMPDDDPDAAKPIAGVVKILLGVRLLFLARQAVAQPAEAR